MMRATANTPTCWRLRLFNQTQDEVIIPIFSLNIYSFFSLNLLQYFQATTVWKMRERERLTWVAGLAIDVPISAPTSKAQGNSIHEQVKKQQWSCYVSPNRLRHSLSTSPFLLASILISSSPQKQIPALYREILCTTLIYPSCNYTPNSSQLLPLSCLVRGLAVKLNRRVKCIGTRYV